MDQDSWWTAAIWPFCPSSFLKHQDQYVSVMPDIPSHTLHMWTIPSEQDRYVPILFLSVQMFYFLSYTTPVYKLLRHPLFCPDPPAFTKGVILLVVLLYQTPLASWHEVTAGKGWHFIAFPPLICYCRFICSVLYTNTDVEQYLTCVSHSVWEEQNFSASGK